MESITRRKKEQNNSLLTFIDCYKDHGTYEVLDDCTMVNLLIKDNVQKDSKKDSDY